MRGLRLAVVLTLAGGALVLLGVTRPWVDVVQGDALTVEALRRSVDGTAIAPELRGLGLVALAGVLALVATRGFGRVLVGALLAASGAATFALAAHWLDQDSLFAETERNEHLCVANGVLLCHRPSHVQLDRLVSHRAPVWLAVAGGALVLGGGSLTFARGRGWAGLGSSYEPPGAEEAEPVTDKGVWDALDRGDDPTA